MYVVKVYKKEKDYDKLFGIKFYNNFENAVADTCTVDGVLFDLLPHELIETLGRPNIYCCSDGVDGVADDFEFRYDNGITIYIGKIMTED